MAYIKPSKPFNQELEKVLAYALFEFGVTTVKRFNQAYQSIRNRLAIHPYSSPKEPLLKSFLRSYRSAIIPHEGLPKLRLAPKSSARIVPLPSR